MQLRTGVMVAGVVGGFALSAQAGSLSLTRTFSAPVGGANATSENALAAEATFETRGLRLMVTLRNTTSQLGSGVSVSDAMLTSMAFNMPSDVNVRAGDRAVLAGESRGLGKWATRREHSSVSDNWGWTEGGLEGEMSGFTHAVTTDRNLGADSKLKSFGRGRLNEKKLGDAFGGLISGETSSLFSFNGKQFAVENAVMFQFTLDQRLTMDALAAIANSSMIRFGDNTVYMRPGLGPSNSMSVIPLPGASGLAMLGLAGVAVRRRR